LKLRSVALANAPEYFPKDHHSLFTRAGQFGSLDQILPPALVMVVNYVPGNLPAHYLVREVLYEFVAECLPWQVRALLIGHERQAPDVVGAKVIVWI
jgi:hypothetical protein